MALSTLGLLVGLLAALACAPAVAQWHLEEFFSTSICDPLSLTRRDFHNANLESCTPHGCEQSPYAGVYSIVTCDVAYSDLPGDTLTRASYPLGSVCTGTARFIDQRPLSQCVKQDNAYSYATCIEGGASLYVCGEDSACETCDLHIYGAGCVTLNGFPGMLTCNKETPPPGCSTEAFTADATDEPFWQLGGNELDADPVSTTKDCHAVALDGTVLGGWTVVFNEDQHSICREQYCCGVRGYLDVDQSVTRCDGGVRRSTGFFFQGVVTYENCYASLDPNACVDLPDGTLEGPVAEGALVAEEPAELPNRRTFAITLPALKEGAWQVLVTGHGWHYCTGRGMLTDNATCRVNACVETPNFITIGAATPGGDCYHTCYHEV